MDSDNPLTTQHCACLDRVLENSAKARKILQDCKECGLPTDDLEQQVNQQEATARAIKAKFFPLQS